MNCYTVFASSNHADKSSWQQSSEKDCYTSWYLHVTFPSTSTEGGWNRWSDDSGGRGQGSQHTRPGCSTFNQHPAQAVIGNWHRLTSGSAPSAFSISEFKPENLGVITQPETCSTWGIQKRKRERENVRVWVCAWRSHDRKLERGLQRARHARKSAHFACFRLTFTTCFRCELILKAKVYWLILESLPFNVWMHTRCYFYSNNSTVKFIQNWLCKLAYCLLISEV